MSLLQKKNLYKPNLTKQIQREKRSSEFQKFFRLYIHAIKTKQLFFIYKGVTSNVFALIKCLEINSRIAGYYFVKEFDEVKIFLNYDLATNKPLIQKILFFSFNGKKRIASRSMLKLFHTYYPHSLGIVETRYGIISSKECQAKHYGGEFLVSIT